MSAKVFFTGVEILTVPGTIHTHYVLTVIVQISKDMGNTKP